MPSFLCFSLVYSIKFPSIPFHSLPFSLLCLQRYSKSADWEYIERCAALTPVPLIGNGDILSYTEYEVCMCKSIEETET